MADIQITDITNGSLDANDDWSGTGVFDRLVSAVNSNIEGQYNKGRLKGPDYANVYLGAMQAVLSQSIQYVLQEKRIEAEVDLTTAKKSELELNGTKQRLKMDKDIEKATSDLVVAEATEADKIAQSAVQAYVAENTKASRVLLSTYQSNKANNEALYVAAQQTAMEEQVIDNRKIKALDSLADTYGTFGAGGLDLTANMWSTYFGVVVDLAGGTPPQNTGATRVT